MITSVEIKEEQIDPDYVKIEQEDLENIKDEIITKKICQYCGKMFSNDYIMKLHLRMHIANNSCLPVLSMKADMKPVNLTCEDKIQYKCTQCDINLENSRIFKSHMWQHGEYFPFKCKFCPSRFGQATALKQHYVVHSGERIQCDQCNKSFSSLFTIKRHVVHIHKAVTRFKCSLCSVIFPVEKAYRDHLARHKQNPQLLCKICNRYFSNRICYWKHTRFDHVFKCDKCRLSFISKHSLQTHSRDHFVTSHQCKHCLKCFKLPLYLKNHLKKNCKMKVNK